MKCAHATVIQTLVESQTPDLGLEAQFKVVTVFSKVKDLSNSNKIIFTEEYPLFEPSLEGGPKITELSEDFVASKS